MGMEVAAIVAIASTAVAGGVQAYSQYQSGQAQKAMHNYNARIQEQTAQYNAKLARNAAIAEEQAHAVRSQQMRDDARRRLASQRAAFGKTGAMISEGTPLSVLSEQAGMMEHDILLAKHESDVTAQRHRQQAAMGIWTGQQEAAMSRFAGKQASTAGKWGAGSTLLSTVSSAAGQYEQYKPR